MDEVLICRACGLEHRTVRLTYTLRAWGEMPLCKVCASPWVIGHPTGLGPSHLLEIIDSSKSVGSDG